MTWSFIYRYSRAKARLCNHGAVKSKIDEFRKSHPDWKSVIQAHYQYLGVAQAKKSKLQKKKKAEKVSLE